MLFNYVNTDIPRSFISDSSEMYKKIIFLPHCVSLEYDTAFFVYNITIRVNSRSNLESAFLDHVRLFIFCISL